MIFATEYYPPVAPGGAEWTNEAWARALVRAGQPVTVVTPNYGTGPRLTVETGVTIVRVPFPVKLAAGQRLAPWYAHRHPLWTVYFAGWVWHVARRMHARLIHAQSKRAIVASWIAARLLGIPVFATIRDLGLLCPLGSCALMKHP